ncbi:MAG: hypothetical protein KatS3mg040_0331 [Candidatus Kapaibacterium sp.]|nr:MAG: hypothetical protein KatS3mg040_0331 [Candidatus Kapabacteria bacterium]
MRRLLALLVTAIVGGCMTLQHPPNYVSDSAVVTFDEQEGMRPIPMKPKQQLIFSTIGQSYRIRLGEPIEIVYSQIDVANSMLVASTEEGSDVVTLTLQRRTDPVVLNDKCQTVELRGVNQIPPIIATNNENIKQQVIITPILSQDCSTLLGYEVRYGSIQQGCTKTSYLVERLSGCRGTRRAVPLDIDRVHSLKKLWFNIGLR